ncbi:helix-turn-helix domain-containing protein [Streptomyces cinereoruber]|uniref:helix-turn-helix domain-containing protein n=1 Tax=Streptomyces cinereoruber TaxID=67260 RepID=UPI00363F97FB
MTAGRWSRAVVEAADVEGIRAALPGVVSAWWAAERLTEALGAPLPFGRPSVTATAVGHLVRAGLLVYLGGDVATPDVHPDQVAALARRRDLPALLDRHVPLGPDQAARRLGVRRTEWDQVVHLRWIAPVGTVTVDYKRARGGVTDVPLYSGQDVALLPLSRPSVDWRALRALAPGRRSPLAVLDPVGPVEGDTVFLAEAARMAGVGRATVVNWRRRHDDFPAPAAGTDVHPRFERSAVVAWLLAHGKIPVPAGVPSAALTLWSGDTGERRFRLDDPVLELSEGAAGEDRLFGWMTDADADALAALTATDTGVSLRRLTAPATPPLAVPGGVRVTERYRSGSGGLRVTLAWPAGLRGTADRRPRGGLVRHAVPYPAPGGACRCARQACDG